MKQILIVEDEYAIRDLLTLNLQLVGYQVMSTDNAESAISIYSENPESFDIAILDIMLPGMSGLELCSILRRENQKIGLLILSAKTQEKDKIEGLTLGADDYIEKPFSVGELIARVDAVYRRVTGTNVEQGELEMKSGDFALDKRSRIVTKHGVALELTQVEYQLMELFFDNLGVALDRDRILKTIWGKNYFGDVKIVDVNICRLRMKIEDEPNSPKHICTIWGYGYRWNI